VLHLHGKVAINLGSIDSHWEDSTFLAKSLYMNLSQKLVHYEFRKDSFKICSLDPKYVTDVTIVQMGQMKEVVGVSRNDVSQTCSNATTTSVS